MFAPCFHCFSYDPVEIDCDFQPLISILWQCMISLCEVRESLTLGEIRFDMPREMTVSEGISSLRSVRKFKSDPIPEEKLRIILESASKGAIGSNTPPGEFVVVRDAEMKARPQEPMVRTWLERLAGGSGMSQRIRDVYHDSTDLLPNTATM